MAKRRSKKDKLKGLIFATVFLVLFFNFFGAVIAAILWYISYQKEIKHFLEKQNIQINLPDVPTGLTPKSKSHSGSSNLNNLFNKKTMKKVKIMVTVLAIAIIGLIAFSSAVKLVENGTVGVVTRFGEVTGRVMKPGLNFKIPFADRVIVYNTQKVIYETSQTPGDSMADYTDYPVDTSTEDGQQIKVTYTARFSVDPDKVTWIANNLGNEEQIVEKIVKTDSRINARNVPRAYKASDLYTGNILAVSEEIEEELSPVFAENGLILDEFGVRNIIFSNEYIDAIESKQIEAEKIVTEQNIAEQEKFKKQAAITRAEGEAEAQKLQQQTLTNELLQKMWIEKWDGKLPTYQGDTAPLVQLP